MRKCATLEAGGTSAHDALLASAGFRAGEIEALRTQSKQSEEELEQAQEREVQLQHTLDQAKTMEFKVQYFGSLDRMLYTEVLEADELVDVLDWARGVLRQAPDKQDTEPADQLVGYVVVDSGGRLVARGYKRSGE